MAGKLKASTGPSRRQPRRGDASGNVVEGASHERRALQARADTLAAELRAVSEELEAFSYSVSHDLRAPMRHIDGFLRLLEEELVSPSPKASHYMATVAGAARRMNALIDGLLAYSRTARLPLEMRPTDLDALLRELVSRFEHDMGEPRVRWRIGDMPRVRADRAQLRIVLQHLMANARKFSRGQPQPLVEISARDAGGGNVEITVRDNGVGFDPRHAERLFGVFQRLHEETAFEGNGIGLAIVRRILRRHGHDIRAAGEPGGGAQFTFSLARAEGP